jgi:DNA-binding transcriptional regulator YiaG
MEPRMKKSNVGSTLPKVPRACKSRALAALHENVCDLHRLGLIDEKAMRKFDAACLAPARKPARSASK